MMKNVGTTKVWKVYGMNDHRQKESFNESYEYDFSSMDEVRVIEVINTDRLNNENRYTIVRITRNTEDECIEEIEGQVSDGIFENCRTGDIKDITDTYRAFNVGDVFRKTCWFTGGSAIYECIERKNLTLTFRVKEEEPDGFSIREEKYNIMVDDEDHEYVIINTYKGHESRITTL